MSRTLDTIMVAKTLYDMADLCKEVEEYLADSNSDYHKNCEMIRAYKDLRDMINSVVKEDR